MLMEDDNIPSRAIWDPTLNSSSGSLASFSSDSTFNTSVDDGLAVANIVTTTAMENPPACVYGDASSSETDLRMRILDDSNSKNSSGKKSKISSNNSNSSNSDQEEDRMGSMLMNNISSAHGRGNDYSSETDSKSSSKSNNSNNSKGKREANNNQNHNHNSKTETMIQSVPLTPTQQLRKDRHKFVHSYLTHLTDKQLKTQLWDSFRLARVVTGKPIKGKRKGLSHNMILNAIQRVAEMKIQILRMSEELDGYRQDKRQRIQKEKRRRRRTQQQEEAEDSSNSSSSTSTATSHPSVYGRATLAAGGSITTQDSKAPKEKTNNTDNVEQAIQLLQQESDLARDQLRELEQQHKQHKGQQNQLVHEDDPEKENRSGARRVSSSSSSSKQPSKPKTTRGSTALFLSPSSSTDEEDSCYNIVSNESAEDILYAFRGTRGVRRTSTASSGPVDSSSGSESEAQQQQNTATVGMNINTEEIRLVLQKVVALKAKEEQSLQQQQQRQRLVDVDPEVTTTNTAVIVDSSASGAAMVHEQVISLLTRLSSSLSCPCSLSSSWSQHQSGANTNNGTTSPCRKSNTSLPFKELQQQTSPPIIINGKALVTEEDYVAHLEVARKKAFVSEERVLDLAVEEEILIEHITDARANTTPNRTILQLERLEAYKKEVQILMKQEIERAQQISAMDTQLSQLAHVCVNLEDSEGEFREKHERHQRTLRDFGSQTQCHTDRFHKLLGSIDRAISKQHAKVFEKKGNGGLEHEHKDEHKNEYDHKTKGGHKVVAVAEEQESDAEKIRRLKHLLAKQNVELFNAKAKLHLSGR